MNFYDLLKMARTGERSKDATYYDELKARAIRQLLKPKPEPEQTEDGTKPDASEIKPEKGT